ncbi:hypothetical protein ColTof4_06324 [Colletotrichum tofieldiae]|nr:hypothetical protein ColTof3_01507 [Colletotrichum tofieldiae]GKT73901.1 hypothetical protein ColTof4_06324 [Colletotrichum tofieldiae]GKT95870.1 hypothetical protein Ct61P_13720 [Colletotrichum tofieldiae]
MQTKVLAAVVTALSFAPVKAAILPRATITPGTVVLPEVVFNPSDLVDPAYTAFNLIRTDILKTTTLVGDITHASGTTVKDRTDQVSAVIRQVTSNTNNIRTRVGTIIGSLVGAVPSGIPAPSGNPAPSGTSAAQPAVPTAEVLQVAQDALARTATSQLQALQTQGSAVTDLAGKAAYTLAYTQASLALQIALSTVAAASSAAIDAVADSLENVNGIAERVRSVKFKLAPVLVIGVTPDVTF